MNTTTLKKDIQVVDREKIDKLIDLNPISFQFKNDIRSKKHFGFIAQDIEKIYPELVKDSEMGYKTVNYIELIPILVSKIQLMDKEIKELNNIILELKENK